MNDSASWSLAGLENLAFVGSDLSIDANPLLASIDALAGLTRSTAPSG